MEIKIEGKSTAFFALYNFLRQIHCFELLFPSPPLKKPHIEGLYLNKKGILQIIHNGSSASEFLLFDLIEYLEAIAEKCGITEIWILDCPVSHFVED